MLTADDAKPTMARIKALSAAVSLADFQGDVTAAQPLAEEAYAIAVRRGDPLSRAFSSVTSAHLALFSGDLPCAVEHCQNALPSLRAEKNPLPLLFLLSILALCEGIIGGPAQAARWQQEMLTITKLRGESMYKSYALKGLAFTKWKYGDMAGSAQLLKQALILDRLLHDKLNASMALQGLGWIASTDLRFERAAMLLGAAEKIREDAASAPVTLSEMIEYQQKCIERIRHAQGEPVFVATFARGRALSFEDAVALALEEQSQVSKAPVDRPETILTRREQQVAELVAQGMTNKNIAAKLVISLRTAQGHVEHILTKLGFTSRTQIAAWIGERHDVSD